MPYSCPLCGFSKNVKQIFHKRSKRYFHQCDECDLLYVNEKHLLNSIDEKKRYNLHDNTHSEGHKSFLRRFWLPFSKSYLKNEMKGLDYGEGPSALLKEVALESNFKNLEGYDLFFNKNEDVFKYQYDFLVLSEVIEHIRNSHEEIKKILRLIKPDGFLILSTELWDDQKEIENWQYMADPTHISIFSAKTIDYLCAKYALDLLEQGNGWFIFLKR